MRAPRVAEQAVLPVLGGSPGDVSACASGLAAAVRAVEEAVLLVLRRCIDMFVIQVGVCNTVRYAARRACLRAGIRHRGDRCLGLADVSVTEVGIWYGMVRNDRRNPHPSCSTACNGATPLAAALQGTMQDHMYCCMRRTMQGQTAACDAPCRTTLASTVHPLLV